MEKIDELRRLLDLPDRDVVSVVQLEGVESFPDPATHGTSLRHVRTGDRALIFVGPADQLDGLLTHNADGSATLALTFPASPVKVES